MTKVREFIREAHRGPKGFLTGFLVVSVIAVFIIFIIGG